MKSEFPTGNPVAVTAGIAMLRHIEAHPEIYDQIDKSTSELAASVPAGCWVNRVGSMSTLFFQPGPVRNYEEARQSDTARFRKFFHHLLENGVYFPPSQYEAAFVSSAHNAEDIAYTARVISEFAA